MAKLISVECINEFFKPPDPTKWKQGDLDDFTSEYIRERLALFKERVIEFPNNPDCRFEERIEFAEAELKRRGKVDLNRG
jgi:hypothetical protein